MATTAFTIYSHYDPQDRELLELETGQATTDADSATDEVVWQSEAVKAFKRKQAPPPRFVPATSKSTLDWTRSSKPSLDSSSNNEISGWYRSVVPSAPSPNPSRTRSTEPKPHPRTPIQKRNQKPTKNDWFIQKVLSSSSNPSATTPAPSLADMLARNPPPSPTQSPFKPPVFLALGPSNKGWAMLQNSGWNEGEALGLQRDSGKAKGKGKGKSMVKQEEIQVDLVGDGEITEIRKVSVVDLTEELSDSESESDDTSRTRVEPDYSGRKALLTPITTVLKSDRLGIGLKAKTVGPHKASMKRVTHNAAALAAHYQQAEEARVRKKKWGSGRRGFAKRDKEESRQRQNLYAYLNS